MVEPVRQAEGDFMNFTRMETVMVLDLINTIPSSEDIYNTR